jgi:hypothetical protein
MRVPLPWDYEQIVQIVFKIFTEIMSYTLHFDDHELTRRLVALDETLPTRHV